MMDEGDLAEAQAMAKHAQDGIRLMGADIEDDLADDHPFSDKTWEAQEHVGRAAPLAAELVDDLKAATPKPGELMGPGDRQRMNELKRRQRELEKRLAELRDKAQKKSKELPGTAGEMAQK